MTNGMTKARATLKSTCGRGDLNMEVLKNQFRCRFLFDLNPNRLVMEEMYKIPPIYVIIKPMIVLFMSYDYDIA